jgi:hypothetical protein
MYIVKGYSAYWSAVHCPNSQVDFQKYKGRIPLGENFPEILRNEASFLGLLGNTPPPRTSSLMFLEISLFLEQLLNFNVKTS